ncbi:hypothetical protein A4A49_40030 [Nicotiana attenuata]|uniref:Uncharacterized protein n=1 Tax=Nicotiana attenuata TaxID=49451 RepID=A0A1J6KAN6_NICAT|nr:hypothetical protein A4A49_40030 [Nicotiana attenuata]
MARHGKTVHDTTIQSGKLITPGNGVQKELPPLTFESFLPQKYQSSEEAHETSSSEGDVQFQPVKAEGAMIQATWQLQYSETSGSEKPTPTAADIVRGNRNSQMGKPLSFVPPIDTDGKRIVKLTEEDLQSQADYWNTSLIGFIHSDEYCIFKFHTIANWDQVLQSGPYTYMNKPMVLRLWEIDFSFNRDILSTVPVWVRFPRLPGPCGGDAACPLPNQIEIESPFRPMVQTIDYDWRPVFCNDCLKFGHDSIDCWHNTKCNEEVDNKERERPRRQKKKAKKPTRTVKQTWLVKKPEEIAFRMETKTSGPDMEVIVKNLLTMLAVAQQQETMARRGKTVHDTTIQSGKLITPGNGVQKELPPLTFESFLPQKYQSSEEAHETSSSEGDVQFQPVKAEGAMIQVTWRLHYSKTSVSEKPTPTAADIVRGNRTSQMGKPLSFVPPIDTDGKRIVKLSEEDLQSQADYWKTSLIGMKNSATSTLPSPEITATPANAIQSQARPLTFGSFLPIQFQTICKEPEEEEKSENQLNLAGKRVVRRTGLEVPRRLQFSNLAKSTAPIPDESQRPAMVDQEHQPMEEKPYQRNRSSQMGKALTYIPPDMHGDTFVVTIVNEDTKEQQEYWGNSLIGQRKTQEESDGFVEKKRKNRKGRKRRNVVTKWMAKEKSSTTNDPNTSVAKETVTEPQGIKATLDENEFPELVAPIRKEGSKSQGKRVADGGLEEQAQATASCSTNHVGITNRFEVLTQGYTSSDTGQGGFDHPKPP